MFRVSIVSEITEKNVLSPIETAIYKIQNQNNDLLTQALLCWKILRLDIKMDQSAPQTLLKKIQQIISDLNQLAVYKIVFFEEAVEDEVVAQFRPKLQNAFEDYFNTISFSLFILQHLFNENKSTILDFLNKLSASKEIFRISSFDYSKYPDLSFLTNLLVE
jgi:oligoendopeptidase F